MKDFDIIIIGSGIGGLVCADILGKEGYKVGVIEKNRQIGGSLQTYVRDRVIFDSGVHYLGGLSKGQNLYQIFQYLGIMDKLKLKQMDLDQFDKIIIENDEKEYTYAQGYDNFIAKLLIDFPDEEKGLIAYCDKIKEVCSKFPLYNFRTGSEGLEKADVLSIDAKAFIESVTSNEKLREVLAGNNPLYAGQPGKTPLYVHALIINSYIESSWKCIDGGSQIAKYIAKNIRAQGGDVIRNTAVTKIVEEEGKITHVELSTGERLYADHFISNVHPVKTLEMTETSMIKKAYRNRVNTLENSVSSYTLNIVFKENCFKYFSYNYYCCTEGSVWDVANYTEANWPKGYAVFMAPTSRSDEYADGMTILSYMRFDEVKQWENSYNTVSQEEERGESYEAFKKRKAEVLLDHVEKKFPGIRACIKSYYTATPLSYRDYIGNDDGSLYGIVKDYRDPLKTFISPRTKVPNLYFTGQNLNMHGVLGAAMSGLVTCSALLGNDDIVEKIKNA
ncbi:MAG TPA: FAD-dependent oxidoreductase [Ferruginibacter sp.]|nr:FAD-dependent oxidoreductase [Ferruginibacter sp.]